jgi:hypothetical protein
MTVTQELVDRIIDRAKKSQFGLEDEPHTSLNIERYEPRDLSALSMILVGAFHSKYDLISVMNAALETIAEEKP